MDRFTGKGPKNQGCEEKKSTPGGTNRLNGFSNPDLRCRQGATKSPISQGWAGDDPGEIAVENFPGSTSLIPDEGGV
jgi:hypothetical protein